MSSIVLGVDPTLVLQTNPAPPADQPHAQNSVLPWTTITQPVWFIDPANGNDANSGASAALALQTNAELLRRWRWPLLAFINSAVTVTWLGSTSTNDVFNCNVVLGQNGLLTFLGSPTIVRSSNFTARTLSNPAAQQALEMQDGAVVWTPLLNQQLFLPATSSQPNAIGWVAKNVGAGVARVAGGQLIIPSSVFPYGTFVNPAANDSYQVRTLPSLQTGTIRVGWGLSQLTTQAVTFQNLRIAGQVFGGGVFSSDVLPVIFSGCILDSFILSGNCVLNGCNSNNVNVIGAFGSPTFLGGITQTAVAVAQRGSAFFDGDILAQAGGLVFVTTGGWCEIGAACAFDTTLADNAVNARLGTSIECNNVITPNVRLWGTANTGHGVRMGSGATMAYNAAGNKPSINAGLGAGREAIVGGTDKLWAAGIPYVEPTNNAMIVLIA